MKLAISQVCSLHASLPQCIEDYAAGQCRAMEVWLTALEFYLQRESPATLQALLAEHEMALPVASYQGGLLVSQGEERQVAWDLFRQRLQLCQTIGIPTLVIAADVPAPLRQGDIERVQVSLHEAAEAAEQHGVRLALEFQVGSAFGNNLQTAWALVQQTGHPALGICLDLFHFAIGSSKEEDLRAIDPAALLHVQLSDILATPRELAVDQQRILPGEGDLPVALVVDYLHEIQYPHWVSLEILNPQFWEIPPRQFGEIGMAALRVVTARRNDN